MSAISPTSYTPTFFSDIPFYTPGTTQDTLNQKVKEIKALVIDGGVESRGPQLLFQLRQFAIEAIHQSLFGDQSDIDPNHAIDDLFTLLGDARLQTNMELKLELSRTISFLVENLTLKLKNQNLKLWAETSKKWTQILEKNLSTLGSQQIELRHELEYIQQALQSCEGLWSSVKTAAACCSMPGGDSLPFPFALLGLIGKAVELAMRTRSLRSRAWFDAVFNLRWCGLGRLTRQDILLQMEGFTDARANIPQFSIAAIIYLGNLSSHPDLVSLCLFGDPNHPYSRGLLYFAKKRNYGTGKAYKWVRYLALQKIARIVTSTHSSPVVKEELAGKLAECLALETKEENHKLISAIANRLDRFREVSLQRCEYERLQLQTLPKKVQAIDNQMAEAEQESIRVAEAIALERGKLEQMRTYFQRKTQELQTQNQKEAQEATSQIGYLQEQNAQLKEEQVQKERAFEEALAELEESRQELLDRIRGLEEEKKDAERVTLEPMIEDIRQTSLSSTYAQKIRSMYVEQEGTSRIEGSDRYGLNTALQSFIEGDMRVLLLLGRQGSGKLTCLKKLELQLWEKYSRGDYIPIFIPLGSISSTLENAVERRLTELGFLPSQIEELKEDRLLFIFHGLEKLGRRANIYRANALQDWNAKVVISSSYEFLHLSSGTEEKYFAPYLDGQLRPDLLETHYIAPIDIGRESRWLARFAGEKADEMGRWIEVHAFLQKMATRPLYLRLICDHYDPSAKMEELSSIARLIERIEVAHVRQRVGELTKADLDQLECDPTEQIESYTSALAFAFFEQGVSHYKPSESDELDPHPLNRFFINSAQQIVRRKAAPIVKDATGVYSFDSSLQHAYYTTKYLVAHPEYLSKETLTRRPELISMLAVEAGRNALFKKNLFIQLERNENYSSSNALSILVQAGVSFSGYHFKGMNLSGADLRGIVAHSAHFDGVDLRGARFEGAFFSNARISGKLAGAHFGELPALYGHQDSVRVIKHMGKGMLLSASSDLSVAYWNLTKNRAESFLRGFKAEVEAMDAYEDRVLAGDKNGTLSLWDLNTAQRITENSRISAIKQLLIFDEGRKVFCISEEEGAAILNASTLEQIQKLEGAQPAKMALAASEKWIASADAEGISILSLPTLSVYKRQAAKIGSDFSLCFSPDDKYLSFIDQEGEVRTWEFEIDKLTNPHVLKGGFPLALTYSPDSTLLAIGMMDGTLQIRDASQGAVMLSEMVLEGAIHTLSFSPDGQLIASAGVGKKIHVTDLSGDFSNKSQQNHLGAITALVSSTRHIITGGSDSQLRIWTPQTQLEQVLSLHTSAPYNMILDIAASADGKYFASSALDRTIIIYGLDEGRVLDTLPSGVAAVGSLQFSVNGERLFGGGEDGTLHIWDLKGKTGKSREGIHAHSILCLAHAPESQLLITGDRGGKVVIWDKQLQKAKLQVETKHPKVSAMAISAKRGIFLTAGGDRVIRSWNIKTGEQEGEVHGHRGNVNAIAISPSGKWLASVDSQSQLRLTSLDTLETVAKESAHTQSLSGVVFGNSEEELMTTGYDGVMRTWSILESVKQGVTLQVERSTPAPLYLTGAHFDVVDLEPNLSHLIQQKGGEIKKEAAE